jgi:hypothetical protein
MTMTRVSLLGRNRISIPKAHSIEIRAAYARLADVLSICQTRCKMAKEALGDQSFALAE